MRLRQLGVLAVSVVLAGHVMTDDADDAALARGIPSPSAATGGSAAQGRVVLRSYHSSAVAGREHMAIYLPSDYDGHRRFPVIYALHGLPSDIRGYRRIDVSGIGEAAERAGHPAIVVAPQGARSGDRDPEWHDWGPGRDWESMVAIGVVRHVDRRFRTIRSRSARALIGISAGGYGAAIIGIHHLATFSVIQAWSGYFHATNPSGTGPMDLGSRAANAAGSVFTYARHLRRSFVRFPTTLGFYVGDRDSRFLAENRRMHRRLRRAGVPHRFAVYPGGHTRELWDAHMDDWVARAVQALAS
jgi:putative tributyrin esterase